MTLTPSQQAWADEQIGQERSVAHTGTITKVAAGKGGVFVATVTDADGRAATFELAADQSVADAHRGIESTVLVEGEVVEIVDPGDGRVGLVVSGPAGEGVEWVSPPPMTEDEQAERSPTPGEQEDATARLDERERAALKARLIDLLENDADVRAAVAAAGGP